MAEAVNQQEADIATFMKPAEARVAEFGAAITGAGEDTRRAFEGLRSTLSGLGRIGAEAVAVVEKIRKDETLPADYRQKLITENLATTELVTDKLHQAALKQVDQIKDTLAAALRPVPSTDWAERSAHRQSVETLLAGDPATLPIRALEILNSGHQGRIAELLDPEGIALRSMNPHDLARFQSAALGALALATGPATPKVQAARVAAKAIRELNIEGQVAAFTQSSKLRTGAFKALPPRSLDGTMGPVSTVPPAPKSKVGGRMTER